MSLLTHHEGSLVVPALVITEVVYLIATRLGTDAEVRFLGDVADGAFDVEPVLAGDWLPIARLVARYRKLPLGTVDASVAVAADRLGVRTIATLDRRDFSVIRSSDGHPYDLVPAIS